MIPLIEAGVKPLEIGPSDSLPAVGKIKINEEDQPTSESMSG
jgi:hypothetical protein